MIINPFNGNTYPVQSTVGKTLLKIYILNYKYGGSKRSHSTAFPSDIDIPENTFSLFQHLPDHLVREILTHIPTRDLLGVMDVDTRLHDITVPALETRLIEEIINYGVFIPDLDNNTMSYHVGRRLDSDTGTLVQDTELASKFTDIHLKVLVDSYTITGIAQGMGLPEPDTYKYDTINLVGSDVRDFEPLYPLMRDGSLTLVVMPYGHTYDFSSFDD